MSYTVEFEQVGCTVKERIVTTDYRSAVQLFNVLKYLDWPCMVYDTNFEDQVLLATWHYND